MDGRADTPGVYRWTSSPPGPVRILALRAELSLRRLETWHADESCFEL